MDRVHAKTLLFTVADVLEKHKITFFLDYGTLLGALRDGDFISYDNDIDLGVFDDIAGNYSLLYEISKELAGAGIKLHTIWERSAVCFVYEGISIDLNRYVKTGDVYTISLEGKKSNYPHKFLNPLDKAQFLGRCFNIPNYAKELLELGYGKNWVIPIKNKKPSALFKDDIHTDCLEVKQLIPIFSRDWKMTNIPKTAHFYWGESKLPYLRYKTVQSFYELNKDWKIKFYYPEYRFKDRSWPTHEHKYGIVARDFYDELRKLPITIIPIDFDDIGAGNDIPEVYKSDFLRWRILGSQGGLWSDMDILYFKPMRQLYCNNAPCMDLDTFVCVGGYGHSIGFILSAPNNVYYQYLSQKAKDYFTMDNYQSVGVVMLNKEFPDIASINSMFPGLKVGNIPMDVVYAYDATMIPNIFCNTGMDRFTERSIGIHWYAGHALAGEFQNGKVQDCILLNLLKEDGGYYEELLGSAPQRK